MRFAMGYGRQSFASHDNGVALRWVTRSSLTDTSEAPITWRIGREWPVRERVGFLHRLHHSLLMMVVSMAIVHVIGADGDQRR